MGPRREIRTGRFSRLLALVRRSCSNESAQTSLLKRVSIESRSPRRCVLSHCSFSYPTISTTSPHPFCATAYRSCPIPLQIAPFAIQKSYAKSSTPHRNPSVCPSAPISHLPSPIFHLSPLTFFLPARPPHLTRPELALTAAAVRLRNPARDEGLPHRDPAQLGVHRPAQTIRHPRRRPGRHVGHHDVVPRGQV